MTYFGNIRRGIKTTIGGLRLTLRHFWEARNTKGPINVEDENYFMIDKGYVTLQYPHENISIPDNGRNQLDCEIDDCIVCDKCAKICPVDCIDIEAIKSPELIRYTSDGSPVRLHAAKFDIDLAKCCFCGLCTTVCPTECLTMTNEFDYSVIEVTNLNFAFSNLSEAEAQEKRDLYYQFVAEKEANKKPEVPATQAKPSGFKPKIKPANQEETTEALPDVKPKPIFKPSIKPQEIESEIKPTFKPKIKPHAEIISDEKSTKPAFVPKLKPSSDATAETNDKPKFVPKLKPNTDIKTEENISKPAFVPKLKPSTDATTTPNNKPKFVPKLKPNANTTDEKPKTLKPETVLESMEKTKIYSQNEA